ncbi:MAG: histidinol-phosphate transaminase [Desulfotignum sp.]|nr:histidinol-phosphate transaminase [Desulfotignum sp.]
MSEFDVTPFAREYVADMPPYVPGKPILEVQQEYGLDKVVKLSSNECPFELPPELGQAVAAAVTGCNRYPDALCRQLREQVADHLGVDESHLIFCNGAEEGIRLIAQIFLNQGEKAIIPTPIFDAYSTATLLMGAHPVKLPLKRDRIDLEAILSVCETDEKIKLIWLCSPSNPTGDILNKPELDAFLKQLPRHIMVVLDEAYREFVTDDRAVRTEDYLDTDPRVVGLRTFSKAYGLAGLRVGYIVAHPRVIGLVNNVKLPFNVNSAAIAAARYMLGDGRFAKKHVDLAVSERTFMREQLRRRGLEVPESQANFLFVKLPETSQLDGVTLFRRLLPKGFVVRPGTAFGVPGYFRMSLGTREDNLLFLQEFDRAMP